jgi:hypothetical protein
MVIKKYIAVGLGAIYDSQVTNRKQGELLTRTSTFLGALILVT